MVVSKKDRERLALGQEWTTYLVKGNLTPRVRFKPEEPGEKNCYVCHARPGNFHWINCERELSACGFHKYVVDCDCDVREGEPV